MKRSSSFCIAIIFVSSSPLYSVKTKRLDPVKRLDQSCCGIVDNNVAQDIDSYPFKDIKTLDGILPSQQTQIVAKKIMYKKDEEEENIASNILKFVSINKEYVSEDKSKKLLAETTFIKPSKAISSGDEYASSTPEKGVFLNGYKIKIDNVDSRLQNFINTIIKTHDKSWFYKGWDASFYKNDTIAVVMSSFGLEMWDVLNNYCMHVFKCEYHPWDHRLSCDGKVLLAKSHCIKDLYRDLNPLQKTHTDLKSLSLPQVFVLRKLFTQLGTLKMDDENKLLSGFKKLKSSFKKIALSAEEEKILNSLPPSIKVAVEKMR